MVKVLAISLFSFLVWVIVTWAFDPASLLVGLLLALGLAAALRRAELDEARVLLIPWRLLWAVLYVPVLFVHVVRANLDVAYRVLHPALPIRPGIVKARTSLRTEAGRVLLANSITLTPGTLSVDLEDDVLFIHRIYVPPGDPDAATERSLAPFETFIRRIFE